ncbi:MAG TPA: phosphoribosyl-ATP diphosphatase [Phycisphaerales bacterium]|nr:phosphoribosyl-ATP diphosphatase [Phycisphaerales bacterium]
MIVPSIDLMNGHAVQLIGGEQQAIDAGDPRPIAERFALAGEIAVIDLDAAMGTGSNAGVIEELVRIAPCRVGGGIRSREAALRWLDAGAEKIILGTAATPELLSTLPRERLIAALDSRHDRIVTEGWKTATEQRTAPRMEELRGLVSGFLVTFVEHEGRMGGLPIDRARALLPHAGSARVTAAGGVRSVEEVAALDRLGIDAQVGMALYSGAIGLADAIAAPLTTDRRDGLWPTIVCDEQGVALGLAYSSAASLREAVGSRTGVYWSRSRGALWRKGATSGAAQVLLRIDLDCDRDTLRFTVRQAGPGFCHSGTRTCFGESRGLAALARRISRRLADAPPAPGSYTQRLLQDPGLLRAKLVEEAGELAEALAPEHAVHEAADLLYFALTALARAGGDLLAVERELDRRALTISRRPGHAKPTS